MAITITDNFGLSSKKFLDGRVGVANAAGMKSLSNSATLPEGFEVCLNGKWYVYSSSNPDDTTYGRFKLRDQGTNDSIDELQSQINTLSDDVATEAQVVNHKFDVHYSQYLSGLAQASHWDFNGETYRPDGIVCSVWGSDEGTNGVWYLAYPDKWDHDTNTLDRGWVKLISRNDLLKNLSDTANNNTAWSSLTSDARYPQKNAGETISGLWNFANPTGITVVGVVNAGSIESAGEIKSAGGVNVTGGDIKIHETNANIKFGNTPIISSDGSGNVTVDVKRVEADTSDIGDFADHVRDAIGNVIGINNYFLNTSFCGDYQTNTFDSTGSITPSTNVYSDANKYWEGIVTSGSPIIVADSNSMSGYSLSLGGSNANVTQTAVNSLISGQKYMLSWKQAGGVTVSFNGQSFSNSNAGYVVYHEEITYNSSNGRVLTINGDSGAKICEIKLEKGVIPTDWCPSSLDTDPVAKIFNTYRYLKTLFPTYDSGSKVALRDYDVAAGSWSSETLTALAGLSGLYTATNSPFLWAGGNKTKAVELMASINSDNNYLGTVSQSTANNLAKVVFPFNSNPVLVNALIRGKLWDMYGEGMSSLSDHGLDGIIPMQGVDSSDETSDLFSPFYFFKFKNGYAVKMLRANWKTLFNRDTGVVDKNVVIDQSITGAPGFSEGWTISMADNDWNNSDGKLNNNITFTNPAGVEYNKTDKLTVTSSAANAGNLEIVFANIGKVTIPVAQGDTANTIISKILQAKDEFTKLGIIVADEVTPAAYSNVPLLTYSDIVAQNSTTGSLINSATNIDFGTITSENLYVGVVDPLTQSGASKLVVTFDENPYLVWPDIFSIQDYKIQVHISERTAPNTYTVKSQTIIESADTEVDLTGYDISSGNFLCIVTCHKNVVDPNSATSSYSPDRGNLKVSAIVPPATSLSPEVYFENRNIASPGATVTRNAGNTGVTSLLTTYRSYHAARIDADKTSYLSTTSLSTNTTTKDVWRIGFNNGLLTTVWKQYYYMKITDEGTSTPSDPYTEISTASAMNSLKFDLTADGKYYKYTGTTTDSYTNNHYYYVDSGTNHDDMCMNDPAGLTGIVCINRLPDYKTPMLKEMWLVFIKGRLLKVAETYGDAMNAWFTY